MTASEPRVVATGPAWLGAGTGSVDSALEDLMRGAAREIQVAAYRVTTSASDFLRLLKSRLDAGVRVSLVINRLSAQDDSITRSLRDLARTYSHFELYDFQPKGEREDLHAKVIVVDRERALLGSANLTGRGLVANHELGVVLSGKIARDLGAALDRLVQSTDAVRV
jgi:cardiolipin synthase